MKFSFKPHHLKRYKDIAMLFWKYGSADLAKDFEFDGAPEPKGAAAGNEAPVSPLPEELADDLEAMGPTYVKLGQMLSSRADLLPPAYLKALSRLQDKVKPFSYAEVEQIVAAELGVRISKGFSFFDQRHLAAASLGQVHRAALRDGRPVVVKVQRPDIRKQIAEDFEVLEEIATFCDEHTKVGRQYQFVKVLSEFKTTLLQELDYQKEAANLTALANNLRDFPHILVPLPIADYCTRSVLTMEYVSGTKITALSPLIRTDLDGNALAEELFQAYLKQVLVDGFFHADPHAGNIFLTGDGRVALLDLGMVGRVGAGLQAHLLRFLLAIAEGNGDEVVKIVLHISQTTDDYDAAKFHKRAGDFVAEQCDKSIEQQDVGGAVMEVASMGAQMGLLVPSELTILGKTLLQLDQVGKILSPRFNPNASLRRDMGRIMTQRLLKSGSPATVLGAVLEMKEFVSGLPGRVNKILDTAATGDLEINVNTPDARQLLHGFEKIANRITTGMLLAALIVGACILMRVNTSFQILGYPGIAMLCFLAAGGGGGALILSILVKDYRDSHKPPD